VRELFFPPSYYYLIFLICTYLSHRKFKDNFLIASNFDTFYLFKKFILILDQEERTHVGYQFLKV
jgi:hypothetical protein